MLYQFVVSVSRNFISHFSRIKSRRLRSIEVLTCDPHITGHSVRFWRYFGTWESRVLKKSSINLFAMQNLSCLNAWSGANKRWLYSWNFHLSNTSLFRSNCRLAISVTVKLSPTTDNGRFYFIHFLKQLFEILLSMLCCLAMNANCCCVRLWVINFITLFDCSTNNMPYL